MMKFALILYIYIAAPNTNPNPLVINFESMDLCEKERDRIQKYYYAQGYNNVKGICIRTSN